MGVCGIIFYQIEVNKYISSYQAMKGAAACCLSLGLAHLIRMGACGCPPPATIMAPHHRASGRAGARSDRLVQFGDTLLRKRM